jgi:hypothetical protein
MVLAMRRCEIVGVRDGPPGWGTTALISCSMSMVTRPLELTRGMTFRITPVSRKRIELTMGAFGTSIAAVCCVDTGTSSPTLSRAG